jgi:hypothetical protein
MRKAFVSAQNVTSSVGMEVRHISPSPSSYGKLSYIHIHALADDEYAKRFI